MTAPVVLPARLDSAAAIQLAQTLREMDGADVALDAAGVEMMGAKAMQTLLVAQAAWAAAGLRLSVTGLSDKIRSQVALMGLSDLALIEGAAA